MMHFAMYHLLDIVPDTVVSVSVPAKAKIIHAHLHREQLKVLLVCPDRNAKLTERLVYMQLSNPGVPDGLSFIGSITHEDHHIYVWAN